MEGSGSGFRYIAEYACMFVRREKKLSVKEMR